jgi:hypothetical protein
MLSPTGWWLVAAPIDLRCCMDRLLVHVREPLASERSSMNRRTYHRPMPLELTGGRRSVSIEI